MDFTLDEAIYLVGRKALEVERLKAVIDAQAKRIRELQSQLETEEPVKDTNG